MLPMPSKPNGPVVYGDFLCRAERQAKYEEGNRYSVQLYFMETKYGMSKQETVFETLYSACSFARREVDEVEHPVKGWIWRIGESGMLGRKIGNILR